MWRALSEPIGLFLIPFACYVVYLLANRRTPLQRVHWPGREVTLLVIAGLIVAIGGMIFLGVAADRPLGAYRPAHLENGRVTPGHFE